MKGPTLSASFLRQKGRIRAVGATRKRRHSMNLLPWRMKFSRKETAGFMKSKLYFSFPFSGCAIYVKPLMQRGHPVRNSCDLRFTIAKAKRSVMGLHQTCKADHYGTSATTDPNGRCNGSGVFRLVISVHNNASGGALAVHLQASFLDRDGQHQHSVFFRVVPCCRGPTPYRLDQ